MKGLFSSRRDPGYLLCSNRFFSFEEENADHLKISLSSVFFLKVVLFSLLVFLPEIVQSALVHTVTSKASDYA